MKTSTRRNWAAAAALCAAFTLCACDEKDEGKAQSGTGRPANASETKPSEEQGKTAVPTSRTASAAAGALTSPVVDPAMDPFRALFDGSRNSTNLADPSGSAVLAQADPARRAQAMALINAKSRAGLSTGDVPAPNTLPQVVLPKADPSAGSEGGGPVLKAFDSFMTKTFGLAGMVYSRKAWGAARAREAPTPMSPSRVTVHHTDGHPRTALSQSIEEMRGYQSFHMNGRGWADVGYHFVIDGAGRAFEGRPTDVLGAHAEKANANNIGISIMGDYNRDRLNEAQKTTLRHLITFLALKYSTDPRQKGFIQPHAHFNQTDCPGSNVVAFLDELRREVSGDTLALVAGDRPAGAASSFVPLAMVN